MSDATARAVVMLGRALAILALGSLALGVLHAKLSSSERQRTDFRAIVSSLASLSKPAMVLLPYYTVAHIATIVSALAQVAAFKMKPDFDTLTSAYLI
jgi:hypothetical protein